MPYSIQLRFDRESERQILGLSESLAEIGLIDPKKSHGSLPHIAVGVFGDCDPGCLINSVKTFSHGAFDISLSSIGTFPTRENVIFLGLPGSDELSRLHFDLYEQLSPKIAYDRYYQPERWHPHCTIGIDFSDEEFSRAFALLKSRFVAMTCRIERFVITKFRPSQVLEERILN